MPGNDARQEALSERAALDAALAGRAAIERVAETASTNDDLLARVREHAARGDATFAPVLRVADRQTAGRGRHGRRWHALPGRSLTFSIAWQPRRSDLAGLSLAAGVALADALEPPSGERPRIGLKWPNDLWLLDADAGARAQPRGRKLAGILVETAPLGRSRVAVLGVGVNVQAQDVDDAASGLASVDELQPGATPASTLARVAAPLLDALAAFDRDGFAAFAARFAARDLLRGRAVVAAAGATRGIAHGVADDGALLVATADGVVAVTSGEWRLAVGDAVESPC